MKIKKEVLVGLWFLTYNSEANKEFQGQILSKLENNVYLVQLYDWVFGEASTMRLLSLDKLLNADFYTSVKEWNIKINNKYKY